MRRLLIALPLLLAACNLPSADTARMPVATATGGPEMNQNEAIALSSWALKDQAATRGNPERAARAVAAEDWLAGQTRLTPDFGEYRPGDDYFWQQLRGQVRAAVGVAPGTPSQVVVSRLLAAADHLKAGHADVAQAELQPPAFSLGGAGTLAALSNLPQFPAREAAYDELRRNENRDTDHCHFMGGC